MNLHISTQPLLPRWWRRHSSGSDLYRRARLDLQLLEDRVTPTSETGLPTSLLQHFLTAAAFPTQTSGQGEATSTVTATRAAHGQFSAGREVAFIDARIADRAALLAGLRQDVQVVLLDPSRDGVRQMASVLTGSSDVTAMHLVTHGSAGHLQLGSTVLTVDNLDAYAVEWRQIGESLRADADLLVYGCDVGAGEIGAAFVSALASRTGADVAASVNLTGAASHGGDWVLETTTGPVQTSLPFAESALASYEGTLQADPWHEFRVNTTTEGGQGKAAVATAPTGTSIVAWFGQPGTAGQGIRFQRYDSLGHPLGTETLVNQSATGSVINPEVAATSGGHFAVTWVSVAPSGTATVFVRLFGPDGAARTSQVALGASTEGTNCRPVVAMSPWGNAVVTWCGNGAGDTQGIYARWVGFDGKPSVSTFRINTTTASWQVEPGITADANGNFIFTWCGNGPGDSLGVFARKYNIQGTALTGEIAVNTTKTGSQIHSEVACDAAGNFVVAWEGAGVGDDLGIFAQRFNASGAKVGGEFRVNTTTAGAQQRPDVTMDRAGNFVVTWQGDGTSTDVYARRYDASGVPLGDAFLVNETPADLQVLPSVALDPTRGTFLVAWQGNGADDVRGIYARKLRLVNHAPTDLALDHTAVKEGETGAVIGTLTVTDPDVDEAFTFDVDDARFEVVGGQLKLVDGVALDYETEPTVPVILTVTDRGGLTYQETFTITVEDVVPTVDAGVDMTGDDAVDEGTLVERTAVVDDGGTGEPLTVTWEIRNAIDTVIASGAGNHLAWIATDDGVYTATFTVADAGGTLATDSFEITVGNVAPTAFIDSIVGSHLEGSELVVTGHATDPAGTLDTLTYHWTVYRDGALTPVASAEGVNLVEFRFTPDDQGAYEIRLVVTDEDGGISEAIERVVVVSNAPPQFHDIELNPAAIDEGGQVTLSGRVTDAGHDPITLRVDWGDGHTSTLDLAAGVEPFTFTHTYTDNPAGLVVGPYAVNLEASDDAGGYAWRVLLPVVRNAAPSGELTSDGPVNEGSMVTVFFADPSDPGTEDAATLHYSFALSEAELATDYAAASHSNGAEYVFADDGTYTVYGRILDKDGAIHTTSHEVVVDNVAPVMDISGADTALESQFLTGPEFLVNTTTYGDQYHPATAMAADGRFAVAWYGYGSGGTGIYTQAFDASGLKVGSEVRVDTGSVWSSNAHALAMGEDGRFVVTWTAYDASGLGVYGQRFNADGTKVGDAFLVNTTTDESQYYPDVAMAPDGRFAVSWYGYGTGGSGIHTQAFDASGLKVGSEVAVSTTGNEWSNASSVAMAEDGRFVVTWTAYDESGYGVYGQRFDASGAKVGEVFLVNTTTDDYQYYPDVAMTPDGRFAVSWYGYGSGGWGIHTQVFDASGLKVGGEVRVDADGTYSAQSSVAMSDDGSFVVTWDAYGISGTEVYGQRLDAGGAKVGGVFLVNTTTDYYQYYPDVAMASDGRFVVTWMSANQDGSGYGVYGRRFGQSEVYTLTLGAVSDPGADTVQSYTIDWGDGSVSTIAAADLPASRQVTHEYADGLSNPEIVVSVTDEDGTFEVARMPITVENVAPAVAISADAGNSNREGEEQHFGSSVTDVAADEAAGFTYAWSVLLGGVDVTPVGADVDDPTFAYTPPDNGSYTIRLEVTDKDGGVGVHEMALEVENVAPLMDITDADTVHEHLTGEAYTLTLGAVSDPGADTVQSYTIDWGDGSSSTIAAADLPVSREVSHEYADGLAYPEIVVSVTDEDGTFEVARKTITVENVAPAVAISADAGNSNREGEEQHFGSSVTDVAADEAAGFSYHWSVLLGGVDVTPVGADVDDPTFAYTPPDDGEYTIRLEVTDKDGGVGSHEMALVVENVAPVLETLFAWTMEDEPIYIPMIAFDVPADTLSITAVDTTGTFGAVGFDAGWLHYDPVGAFQFLQVGEPFIDSFRYTVSDEDGGSTDAMVVVQVTGWNDAPTGIALDNLSVSENLAGTEIGALTVTDPDVTDSHSFTVSDPRFEVVGDQLKLVDGEALDHESEPSVTLTVTATDSGGLSVDQEFTITVTDANDAPTLTLPDAQTTEEGTALVFSSATGNALTVDDQDGDALTVSLAVDHGTLSLSGIADLTFTDGDGTDDASMTFTGSIASVNAALEGMSYTSAVWYEGSDSLTVTVSDGIALPILGAVDIAVTAAFHPAGGEVRVNTTVASDQNYPRVAMNTEGDSVVVWQSLNQDGGGWGIYGQRYDATGATVGGEFLINTTTTYDQNYPTVAMAEDGSFVVAWQGTGDGDGLAIHAQRFDATGVNAGGEFLVNTTATGDQSYPVVAMAADGRFVIAWESDYGDGSLTCILAQRYDSDGTAAGGEFRVNTYTSAWQGDPSVAMDPSGNFVITWNSGGQDTSGSGIYGQRYASDGTAVGDEFQVNSRTLDDQANSSVAMDALGNFVVTWQSLYQDGSDWGVYGQRYASDGTAVGDEFRVNTCTLYNQADPSVAMGPAGNFVVTWNSMSQDGSSWGIYGQRYASDGTPVGEEFRVNTWTPQMQYFSSVAMDASGNFVVTWTSNNQDGSGWGVYAQRYVVNTITWAEVLSSTDAVTTLSAGYADTHDGGATADSTRQVLWATYGNEFGGSVLHWTNILTGATGSVSLPFSTHGSYPTYDGAQYVYINAYGGYDSRFCRVDVDTKAVTVLASSPSAAGWFCKGAYQGGRYWLVGTSGQLMVYNPTTNSWSDNVYSLGQPCNLVADANDPDVLWVLGENASLLRYSISSNSVTVLASKPGGYWLGGNNPLEFVPSGEGLGTGYLVAQYGSAPFYAYNIATNTWAALSWTSFPEWWGQLAFNASNGTMYYQCDAESFWRAVTF